MFWRSVISYFNFNAVMKFNQRVILLYEFKKNYSWWICSYDNNQILYRMYILNFIMYIIANNIFNIWNNKSTLSSILGWQWALDIRCLDITNSVEVLNFLCNFLTLYSKLHKFGRYGTSGEMSKDTHVCPIPNRIIQHS